MSDILSFVRKWNASNLTERSAAPQHFRDLCDALGIPHPTQEDVSGETYTFEKRVAKTGGGEGFADVWKRGWFAWEYKSKGGDLNKACTGTQLREVESGFRYTPTSTFSTFPFPWSPGTEPSEFDSPIVKAIADAARNLVQLRDNWLNPPNIAADELKDRTLTKLYNQRPTWLANAHQALDEAVFAAYGWPTDLADQEILARLLALNHERAAAQAV